jgi:SMODS-associating 2TM, beta-strand rich effector domain
VHEDVATAHEYVATSVQRHRVVWILASISIAASAGLGVLFHQLKLPSWIAPPTGAVIFGLVFWLYNKYVWRLPLVSSIPDLNGKWEGTIDIRKSEESEEPENGEKEEPESLACTVRITQTWLAMSIKFETQKTKSHSVTATLGAPGDGGFHYEYDVTVEGGQTLDKNSKKTEGRHFGTAHLAPKGGSWLSLKGDFYNDRGFQRWGNYEIERVSRRVKD